MKTHPVRCLAIVVGSNTDLQKATVECGLAMTPLDTVTWQCPNHHRQRSMQDKGLLAFSGLWDET